MSVYKFKCPECGCTVAIEHVDCEGVNSEITHIGDGGLEYAPADAAGDIFNVQYECRDCNFIVPNASSQDEFIEWCKNNCTDVEENLTEMHRQFYIDTFGFPPENDEVLKQFIEDYNAHEF